ncbi:uncharacterized [Tachysurus ichikawai]
MKEASDVLRALSFMAAYHRPGMAHSQRADQRSRQQKGERQAHKRKPSHIHKHCSESEREWVAVAHGNHGKTAF